MVGEEVINQASSEITQTYLSFIAAWGNFGEFVNIFMLVLLVILYSVFIWKLHKFIARKDFLNLDLNKYNTAGTSFGTHFLSGLFYFLEYLLISPFLIFFWFVAFTIFMIVLIQTPESFTIFQSVTHVLITSTLIVATIRVTSYYSEKLSQDLAKLLPFNLLAIAIITPGFFELGRIFSALNQIPSFLDNIMAYLLFIFVLEIVLRFFDFIISLFNTEEE